MIAARAIILVILMIGLYSFTADLLNPDPSVCMLCFEAAR